MKHATIKKLKFNTRLLMRFGYLPLFINKIRVSSSCYYTIFANEKIIDFGPERTAKGFTRIKEIEINQNIETLDIVLMYYGVPSYDLELQEMFIGIEVFDNNGSVYDVFDFKAFEQNEYINESCKYSFQRGFVERYNLSKIGLNSLLLEPIKSPVELISAGQTCEYKIEEFEEYSRGKFQGFYNVAELNFLSYGFLKQANLVAVRDELLEFTKLDCFSLEYSLRENKTGLLNIEIFNAKEGEKIYILFDEYLPNGKWMLGRSTCNDFIEITLKQGVNKVVSCIPYTLKYIMVITKNKRLETKLSLVKIQNDKARVKCNYIDERINVVVKASLNTFKQNAFDLLTDCPGRERAGWLCDSFFTGYSEYFYTGRHTLERNFLENLILSNCPDIPKGMLPMCYPARHVDGNFIPNWAMWFVVELLRYYKETSDRELIYKAKQKVYDAYAFLSRYENELFLLENLPSWVFIEWSKSNENDYKECVSMPSNMLYAGMLDCIYELYGDTELKTKAQVIKQNIIKLAFDGKYFCDNAVRERGQLVARRDHVTETCQYYALYFNIIENEEFKKDMINNFAMNKPVNPYNIPKSNVFIGNFLRMFILFREHKYQAIIDETISYFYDMAIKTGTLWEKDKPTASCNHGLNACLAVILCECANKLGL